MSKKKFANDNQLPKEDQQKIISTTVYHHYFGDDPDGFVRIMQNRYHPQGYGTREVNRVAEEDGVYVTVKRSRSCR